MSEVNPYRLQYIPQQDHSAELYAQMRAPLADIQQRKENEFKAREADRSDRRDQNTNERDRIAERDRVIAGNRADLRERERNATYDRGQQRLQEQGMFERKRLLQQEHEALVQGLYSALNDPGQDPVAKQNRIKAAQEALHRAGYPTIEDEDTPSGPTLPPAIAAPEAPYDSTLGGEFLPAEDDGTAAASMGKGGGAKPVAKIKPVTGKAAATLSSQLDAADQKYSKGLGAAPWLPGQSPVGRSRAPTPTVVQSDAMLDPADPYNNLVK
jgi:hypothetical protein